VPAKPPVNDDREAPSDSPRGLDLESLDESSEAVPDVEGSKNPDDLLAAARQALATGDAHRAFHLSSLALQLRSSVAGLRIQAESACELKRRTAARRSLRQLPLDRRNGLRAKCRRAGVRLGVV
jgi:hypothetical protein